MGFAPPQIMGGVEPILYRGSIWYTPILEEWYYQVEVLKLEVGNQNLNLDCREVHFKLCTASVNNVIDEPSFKMVFSVSKLYLVVENK